MRENEGQSSLSFQICKVLSFEKEVCIMGPPEDQWMELMWKGQCKEGPSQERVAQKWPLSASYCAVLKKWESPVDGEERSFAESIFWVKRPLISSYSLLQVPFSFPLNRGKTFYNTPSLPLPLHTSFDYLLWARYYVLSIWLQFIAVC